MAWLRNSHDNPARHAIRSNVKCLIDMIVIMLLRLDGLTHVTIDYVSLH